MIVTKTREGQQQPEVRQKVNNSNRIFLRLPSSYIPFFQAMAQDYNQRGKIESPSIGLLAKTCLITAGNAWNRMCIQLMNKEYERKMQQPEFQRQAQPIPPQHQKPQHPKRTPRLDTSNVAWRRPPQQHQSQSPPEDQF